MPPTVGNSCAVESAKQYDLATVSMLLRARERDVSDVSSRSSTRLTFWIRAAMAFVLTDSLLFVNSAFAWGSQKGGHSCSSVNGARASLLCSVPS